MENVFVELLTSMIEFGPRWMRVGCTTVLLLLVGGLLLWALWPWK